jgi:hypothetical protein
MRAKLLEIASWMFFGPIRIFGWRGLVKVPSSAKRSLIALGDPDVHPAKNRRAASLGLRVVFPRCYRNEADYDVCSQFESISFDPKIGFS